MRQCNFVTLSPECRNIELVKDVGQIPYVLGREHRDIKTFLAASRIDPEGDQLGSVKGLNLVHVPRLFGSTGLAGGLWLLFHARKTDWLSVHHAGRRSYYWTRLYKLLNPGGKAYLKLDLDFRSCDMYDRDEWERKVFSKNMDIMDLVTVESQAVKDRIQKYSSRDIRIISNGYCKTDFDPDLFQKRSNTFLTVGRLGTKQKATEILLEAFAQSAAYHSWNLKLIGTIEEDFQKRIDQFYLDYPDLRERVVFTGEIKGRRRLYDEYCRARVFVLPSRWESFGIVGAEALSCGCRLILSDQVPPGNELTGCGRYGRIAAADDVEKLREAMISETKTESSDKEIKEIKAYADARFSWSRICEELYQLLLES